MKVSLHQILQLVRELIGIRKDKIDPRKIGEREAIR